MKFFAILRDSLREALDAKVIYFMFGLSALAMLAVASISFKAEPPEKGLSSILARLPGGQAGFGNAPLSYTLENFEQTNNTPFAYKGEYRYDLVVTEHNPGGRPGGPNGNPQPGGAQEGSAFRSLVVLYPLMTTPEKELTKEQRELRAQLGEVMLEMMRSGGKPSGKQVSKAAEAMARQIAAVGPPEMEDFLKKQLAGAGALEVTKMTLKDTGDNTYRFQVECKARPDTVRTWPHSIVVGFGALTIPANVGVGMVVYTIENSLIAGIGAGLAMMLSTIITAFFIPNMLRKGTVDLLVSKPIHRWSLLVSKYIGGLTFMFVNTVVIVVGIWVVLGVRSGLWGTGFLLSIFVLTFQFSIFYAVSTLLAVLTRSPIVCILCTIFAWAILFSISTALAFMKPFHQLNMIPDWAYDGTRMVRNCLPRYKDLDAVNADLIAGDLLSADSLERRTIKNEMEAIPWAESLGVTLGYIAVLLGLACWRFSVKDY